MSNDVVGVSCQPRTLPARGPVFESADGTAMTFYMDSAWQEQPLGSPADNGPAFYPSGNLLFRDGTLYRVSNGLIQWIRDRNGNTLAFAYDGNSRVTQITDTLERTITVAYDSTGSPCATNRTCDLIAYTRSAGARTIIVEKTTNDRQLRPCSGASATSADPCFIYTSQRTTQDLFSDIAQPVALPVHIPVVSKLTLPDGRSYGFWYNMYGEMARAELPTGGAFEYDWVSAAPGSVSGVTDTAVIRRVSQRRIYSDGGSVHSGGTLEGRQDYAVDDPAVSSSPIASCTRTVSFYDASSALLKQETHTFIGSPLNAHLQYPIAPAPWNEGRETSSSTSNGSTTLRTESQLWEGRAPAVTWSVPNASSDKDNARICQVNTTLGSLTSAQVYLYDLAADHSALPAAYNNRSDVYEFDYGSAPALGSTCLTASGVGGYVRHTHTAYQAGGYDTNANTHLRSLVTQETVYKPSGSTENVVADTKYEYDVGGLSAASGATTGLTAAMLADPHYATVTANRGNATKISRWLNVASRWLDTTRTYDEVGNLKSVTSPRQNTTTYDYTDSFTSTPSLTTGTKTWAFPTKVTNALSQVKTSIYDYYLGRPIFVTDVNQSTSTLAYTDPLDRPTSFALGTASTTIAYNGNVIASTVVQNSCGSTGQNVKTELVYDGLGREAESRRYKNGTTAMVTCKAYDGLGRLAQSSNPDEVTSPGTPCSIAAPKYTVTTYDALDRGLTVTHPDNAQISTVWASNQETVTDEAGRARSSTTDALGRLTRVIENPSGSPSYTTNYAYDALDNLTAVSQLGDGTSSRSRSFDYDSLKRLKSATNPESGTITYGHLSGTTYISGYDDDGNLVERKDEAGVVTSYAYDSLNRLSSKTYTGGTPGVNYYYDGSAATKSIGRLIKASTTLQSDNTAAFTTYDTYDEFGRVTKSTQTVGTQAYVFHYTYNAAGGLETEQYPSTRTLTYCYDPAGRPAAVGTKAALSGVLGTNTTNYVPSTTYAKHGGIQSMTLGNIWIENHEYDGNAVPATRLQPTRILVTKPDLTTVLDLRYCYTCGAGNNGNVWTHTIQNLGVTQSFGYDAFNRLTSATETSGGFGQSYVYDAFGNRAVTQNSTQLDTPRTPVQNNDSTLPFNANNQWTLATYDPNGTGNQTGVGSDTFQYDAENRLKQSTQGSVTATYDYDGEGRRVRKTSGSTVTIYVYDAMGEVAAEYGGTPAPVSGTSYVAVDTLGSGRAEVDSQGNVTRHDYLPFGQEIPNSWGLRTYYNDYARADGFTRKFTGKERDAETGLDYFGARYFSGAYGRFTSVDPVIITPQRLHDPQQLNRYAYVRNNPLRLVDPTGEILQLSGDIAAATADLCYLAGNDLCARITVDNGIVSFDTSGLDLSNNEGATLVDQLVSSSYTVSV